MKYLHYGLTGFFMLIGALWFLTSMQWGYETSQYTTATMNGDLTSEQQADAFERIVEGPRAFAWLKSRSDLRSHFRLDDFTDDRVVMFERRMPIDHLLAPNEDRPHPSLYGAYAAARAPAYFAPYCQELLDTIASTCKVFHSESRTFSSQPDTVEIESSVAFIPSYPLGDPSTVENGKMRTAYVRIDKDTTMLEGDDRRALYIRARNICAEVVAKLGNCVIENVRFSDDFLRLTPQAAGARAQHASVRFAVFLNRDLYDRNALDTIVEEIAEALAAQTG